MHKLTSALYSPGDPIHGRTHFMPRISHSHTHRRRLFQSWQESQTGNKDITGTSGQHLSRPEGDSNVRPAVLFLSLSHFGNSLTMEWCNCGVTMEWHTCASACTSFSFFFSYLTFEILSFFCTLLISSTCTRGWKSVSCPWISLWCGTATSLLTTQRTFRVSSVKKSACYISRTPNKIGGSGLGFCCGWSTISEFLKSNTWSLIWSRNGAVYLFK